MNHRIGFCLPTLCLLLLSSFVGFFLGVPAAAGDSSAQPEINYVNIETTIDNNYATTQITEEFYNPYDYAIDDTFTFQIPECAFISNFSLTIDGITYYAKVVGKELAKQQYNEAVSSGNDAALVESYGKTTFAYSISLSPQQTIIVGLRYEQFLEKTLGGYNYKLHLTSGNVDSTVKSLNINVNIKSELKITDLGTPDFKDVDISSDSDNEVTVKYSTENLPVSSDLLVNYELAPVNINGKILHYSDGEHGFFSHVFSPQPKDLGGSPIPKDIIFVLDKSGSMAGDKITQLKDAFDEIVHELREEDYFNIIMFDSGITKYKNELMQATGTNQDTAANFINEIDAQGSTNINEALTTALGMFEDTSETVPIIVFLTDGLPTVGETNTYSIRNNVLEKNTESVAIFTLGFGTDVDFEFLKALALENYGHALRIEADRDASNQMTNFYDTISTPLLKNLEFQYLGETSEVYPVYVEQLFEGTEVVVVGRYNLTEEQLNCNVYATSNDGKQRFSQTFSLNQESDLSFIPCLWAYKKICYLLDEITVKGYDETLVGEVINLAIEYEFVTPYTSLLITVEPPEEEEEEEEVVPPEEDSEEKPVDDTNKIDDTNDDGGSSSTHGTTNDDTDNDGVPDHMDAYPADPAEWSDSDGDGYGDNSDAYPNDPYQWSSVSPQPGIYYNGNDSGYGLEPAPDGGPSTKDEKDEEEALSGYSSMSIIYWFIFLIGSVIIGIILFTVVFQRKTNER